MNFVTKGRTEISCKDNVGGIKAVYLFPFVDYANSVIIGTRGVEVTSFPATEVFKYEVVEGSFNEDITNDENGIFYTQTLSFSLNKQDVTTTNELRVLSNIDFRYIVEYNAGYYKCGGLEKGANVESINITTGGVKGSRNGYSVVIKSMEEWKAPFIDMDNFWINGEDDSVVFDLNGLIMWSNPYHGIGMSDDGLRIFYHRHNIVSRMAVLSVPYYMPSVQSYVDLGNFQGFGWWIQSDGKRFAVTTESSGLLIKSGTTAWDFNNFTTESSWAACPNSPLHFKDDGTMFFIKNGSNFERYDLSTAWDLSTRTLGDYTPYPYSTTYALNNFVISQDLKTIFTQGSNTPNGFNILRMTSAGALSTITQEQVILPNYSDKFTQGGSVLQMALSRDGRHIMCINYGNKQMWHLELRTANVITENIIYENE